MSSAGERRTASDGDFGHMPVSTAFVRALPDDNTDTSRSLPTIGSMPGDPQRSPYPRPEEAGNSPWRTAHAIHGAGDAGAYFKGAPKAPTPWPSAGRTKSNPAGYDPALVQKALRNPAPHMREMDPRDLHATQPSVTSEGVNHYMGPDYSRTGRTFADQHVESNRFPVVYTDTQGRNKIISGHHRATAALLQGRQLRAIHVREE